MPLSDLASQYQSRSSHALRREACETSESGSTKGLLHSSHSLDISGSSSPDCVSLQRWRARQVTSRTPTHVCTIIFHDATCTCSFTSTPCERRYLYNLP